MKKVVFILIIFVYLSVAVFADALPNDNKDNTFYLYLNKNGVDRVWFSETSDTTKSSVYRHIFPLVDSDWQGSVTSTIALNWSLQSDNAKNVKQITVSFLGDDSETSVDVTGNGYMLRLVDDETVLGVNYNVSVTVLDADGSQTSYGSGLNLADTAKTTAVALSGRQIAIVPSASVKTPAVFTLTVKAPYTDKTGQDSWVEAQYIGYIRAEIEYN